MKYLWAISIFLYWLFLSDGRELLLNLAVNRDQEGFFAARANPQSL